MDHRPPDKILTRESSFESLKTSSSRVPSAQPQTPLSLVADGHRFAPIEQRAQTARELSYESLASATTQKSTQSQSNSRDQQFSPPAVDTSVPNTPKTPARKRIMSSRERFLRSLQFPPTSRFASPHSHRALQQSTFSLLSSPTSSPKCPPVEDSIAHCATPKYASRLRSVTTSPTEQLLPALGRFTLNSTKLHTPMTLSTSSPPSLLPKHHSSSVSYSSPLQTPGHSECGHSTGNGPTILPQEVITKMKPNPQVIIPALKRVRSGSASADLSWMFETGSECQAGDVLQARRITPLSKRLKNSGKSPTDTHPISPPLMNATHDLQPPISLSAPLTSTLDNLSATPSLSTGIPSASPLHTTPSLQVATEALDIIDLASVSSDEDPDVDVTHASDSDTFAQEKSNSAALRMQLLSSQGLDRHDSLGQPAPCADTQDEVIVISDSDEELSDQMAMETLDLDELMKEEEGVEDNWVDQPTLNSYTELDEQGERALVIFQEKFSALPGCLQGRQASPAIEWKSTTIPHSQMLTECLLQWLHADQDHTAWDSQTEQDPLWDFDHSPLMGNHVMDHVVHYLSYQANLGRSSDKCVLVVPPSVFASILAFELPAEEPQKMVWTSSDLPTRIVLPVVENELRHCYVWYGDVFKTNTGHPSVCLSHLDSLSNPSALEWNRRMANAYKVLATLFPALRQPTARHMEFPEYRQAPGSLDCGLFVSLTVSAMCFDSPLAVRRPLAPSVIRERIRDILNDCKCGYLWNLAEGKFLNTVTLLHDPIAEWPPKHNPTVQNSFFNRVRNMSLARSIQPPPWSLKSDNHSTVRHSSQPGLDSYHEVLSHHEFQMQTQSQSIERGNSQLSGFSFAYGRASMFRFPYPGSHSYDHFFSQLEETSTNEQGLLQNALGRNMDGLMKAALLTDDTDPPPLLPPGIHVVHSRKEPGLQDGDDEGLSPDLYAQCIRAIPEVPGKVKAMLTGEIEGEQLSLNWNKDTVDLDRDFLIATSDIDSLSLTTCNPEFCVPVAIMAYPSRASTLTTDNGLRVLVDGELHALSHFLNFTCFSLGETNQFKVNVFFPNYKVPKLRNRRYRTMMDSKDYRLWFELVILVALEMVSRKAPPNLRAACLQAKQELPGTYREAEIKTREADGSRSFKGYKITPELLNLMIPEMHRIVDASEELAKFRHFIFHIYGINLKTVGQSLAGRADNNPLLHIFETYRIVPWEKYPPGDIKVDFAVEISVDEDRLPAGISHLTLLWRQDALCHLIRGMWRGPDINPYMHSHQVAGIRSVARARGSHSMIKLQAYHKDMKQTYIHSDNSIGTCFSPADGLGNSKKFTEQMNKLDEVWRNVRSFGIRIEWRCGVWAANVLLRMDPERWLDRFLERDVFLAHHSKHVATLKRFSLAMYRNAFRYQHFLSPKERATEQVQLMAAVLCYFIKGLVKTPDTMSSSRQMAARLGLITRAENFGFATVPTDQVSPCLTRIYDHLQRDDWAILKYHHRKQPAGARLKTSLISKEARALPDSAPTHPETTSTLPATGFEDAHPLYNWTEQDEVWAHHLVNDVLSRWLWARHPRSNPRCRPDLLRGPWKLSRWNLLTLEDTHHGRRVRNPLGFFDIISALLPSDWVCSKRAHKQWNTYQSSVLDPIRARIDAHLGPSKTRYAAAVRAALERHLRTWEFLPAVRKDIVWTSEGTAHQRMYMLYHRPN